MAYSLPDLVLRRRRPESRARDFALELKQIDFRCHIDIDRDLVAGTYDHESTW